MSDEPRPTAVESDPSVSPAAAETANPFAAYSPVLTPPLPAPPDGLLQTAISHAESSSNVPDATSVGGKAAPLEPALSGLLAAPQAPGELGRLGGYKVTKILGRGGMGMVLAAQAPHLGRAVALKVMLPGLAAQREARQRFLLEAKAAAAVEHENIIPIWQVAEDRGVPFLAMPLLGGVSLDEALKMGVPLPLPMVLGIAAQVADGLAAAHAAGLIHRDIKPSNIWLEMHPDGTFRRARILDFGLARLDSGDGGLTKTGTILGTPAYMAPEQARGHKVDGRADLFSFGATLYQMTTGRRPFTGTDELSLLTSLAVDIPTPVRKVNPSVPGPLSDLVDRLLAKQPDDRPQSAREVAAELRRLAAGVVVDTMPAKPAPVLPESPRRRRVWAAIAAAAIAVPAVVGAVVYANAIVRIATDTGELVVETSDPNIDVLVKQDGRVVISDRPKDRTFVLSAGAGVIEFRDPETGVVLKTEQFRIERGGKAVVSATFAPKPPAVKPPLPPLPPLPPFGEPPTVDAPPARAALAAVAALGGKLVLEVNGKPVTVSPGTRLPNAPFAVREVQLDGLQTLTPLAVAPLALLPPVTDKLSLTDSNATNAVVAALAKFPAFRTTTHLLVGGTAVTEDGLDVLTAFPALTHVNLEHLRVTEKGLAKLARVKALQWARVSGDGVTTDGIKLLRGLPLNGFDIRSAPNVTPETLAELATHPDVRHVALMRCPVTDDGVKELAKLPKLQSFAIAAERLTPAGIETIAGMKGIRSLSLLGYRADPAALEQLAGLPIQLLDLSAAALTDDDLDHLAKFKHLAILRVNGVKLSDAAVAKLQKAVPSLRSVERDTK